MDLDENETNQPAKLAALEAQRRVYKIKKFYKSLTSWASFSVMLLAIDLFTSQRITWSVWPIFFWGISIAMQFFKILRMQHLGKSWEERMIGKQGGQLVLPDNPPVTQEDYSEELLGKHKEPVKEKADLSEFRKLKKPWRDEDLV